MRRTLSWFASIAIAVAAHAGGDGHLSLVPWKVIEPGAPRETSALVLFWVPATREELRRSPLLRSDELTLFASQCVAMRIARLDDRELLERLAVEDDLPAVVLADRQGTVLARASASDLAEVEAIVREELQDRQAAAESMLDEAKERVASGEHQAAIAIYRRVWEQRCMCPRQARAAQRALRKLAK